MRLANTFACADVEGIFICIAKAVAAAACVGFLTPHIICNHSVLRQYTGQRNLDSLWHCLVGKGDAWMGKTNPALR